jgi:hypothetical protein
MNFSTAFQIILFILVFISKELVVFNEEVLVLLSFFIFIFLIINYAKSSINESLNSKLEEIKNEFDFYKNLQKQTVSYLINYHKKQTLLVENVKRILAFSLVELKFTENCFSISWCNKVRSNFEDKSKKLINCESQKNLFIQNFYLLDLTKFLSTKYKLLVQFEKFHIKVRTNIVLASLKSI